jgi:hypothetical protein
MAYGRTAAKKIAERRWADMGSRAAQANGSYARECISRSPTRSFAYPACAACPRPSRFSPAAAGRDAASASGLSVVFYPRVPPIFSKAKGWRRFRSRFLAPFADLAAGRFAGEDGGSRASGQRARAPGIRQTIDPMRGQEITPAIKARTGFELLDKRTGASPSCLTNISRPLSLSLIPSFSPCEAGTAAFRRRARRLSSSDKSLCHSSGFLSSNSEKNCWRARCGRFK